MPDRSDDELKQLAMDIADGKVFTSSHVPDHDQRLIPSIFMPLMFMGPEKAKEMGDVTLIYEYFDKAGPRSINGYPMFFSMTALKREEHDRLVPFYQAYMKLKEEFANA